MIAAILRAQFLSMMRIGRGSGLGMFMMALWYALWTAGGVAACLFFRSLATAQLALLAPMVLAGVCAYWQFVPILTASLGAALDMRKLLAFPAPHQQLFLIEMLLRLTTAIEMILVISGTALGLLLNPAAGGWRALPRLLPAILLFILFNILLASGARSLLERLLGRRHVREVFAIIVTMFWVLPRFLSSTGFHWQSLKSAGSVLQFALLPWSATARIALGVSPGSSLLGMCVWLGIAWWFGRTQFERNLHYDAVAAQATIAVKSSGREPWIERFYRWPAFVWRDPLAAIVERELRALTRTPQFRTVFIMGFTFGLLVWFPVFVKSRGQKVDSPYMLVVTCIYALAMLGQASFWNCFGFDRHAAAFYFASPVPLSRSLAGKNLAALVFILLETVILTAVTAGLGLIHGWITVFESLAAIGVATLYMLAAGNINSVRYPRGVNPDRVMHGNAGGRSSGLIFLFYLLALIPVALAYLAQYALNSEIALVVVLAAAAAGGVVLYRNAMQSAVQWASTHREPMLAELSKGEGPVIAN